MGFSGRTKIGEVELDATISQVHTLEADVSDHSVEEGSDISDHVRPRPKMVQLDGQVSDVAIETGYPGQSAVSSIVSLVKGDDPVKAAWEVLSGYFENGELIELVTSLATYENVLIASFAVTRDASSGRILRFSMTLKQIKIVSTATAAALAIPKNNVGGKGADGNKNSAGKKQAKKASQAKRQSVLASAVDAGAGFFGG
jgi:hypothetical protein